MFHYLLFFLLGLLYFNYLKKKAKKLPDIIITNIHKKYSGVTSTIINLYPEHAKLFNIGLYGYPINMNEKNINLIDFLFYGYKFPDNIRCRLMHVRRNDEIIFAIFIRDILRIPIKIIFTDPRIRKRSFFSILLLKKADHIIVTHKKCIGNLPDQSKNISIIPHGIKTNQLQSHYKDIYNLKDKFVISTFGRVRKQKGIHIFVSALIKIMYKYPDVVGIIVGETDIRNIYFKSNLVSLIKKHKLTDRFIFTGFVRIHKNVFNYIHKNTNLTVCVPLREEFGLTPIESLSYGHPVICSDTGAFYTMIDEYKTGNIIPTNDVNKLIESIVFYINDKSKLQKMRKFCLEKVKNNFMIEMEASKINNIYKRLLYSH